MLHSEDSVLREEGGGRLPEEAEEVGRSLVLQLERFGMGEKGKYL